MSSGRLSGRMSRSCTCVGATNRLAMRVPLPALIMRTTNTASSAASAAMISHISICEISPIHVNRSVTHENQRDQSLLGRFCSWSLFQLRRRTVFSEAKSGSDFTFLTALSISACVGASEAGNTGVATTSRNPSSSAPISGRKRTSEFLFDVPGLELRAPVEIHAKPGGDVERLEEQYGQHVGNRDQQLGDHVQVALEETLEVEAAARRTEPEHQRDD